MITEQTLIIGANSDIGKAIALQTQAEKNTALILISRNFSNFDNADFDLDTTKIKKITVADYQAESID